MARPLFIQQENGGLVFPNEVEEGSKAPHLSGYINVEGNQFRIAMWENEKGYFGVKITESDAEPDTETAPAKKSYGGSKKTFTKPTRR